jgi:uroporphyrinogen decarboxylase
VNSKTRVLIAIRLGVPDRVPCDFHAIPIVQSRLFEYLGIESYRQLMEKLEVDIIDIRGIIDPVWRGPVPKVAELSDGVRQNYLGWQMKTVITEFGDMETHCGYIFEDAKDIGDIESFDWPGVDWFDFTNMNELLDEYKDYAIMASGASVFQHPTLVRGMDNLLCDMMISPNLAEHLIGRYTDFYVDYYSAMFEATQGRIDILRIADDFGTQIGSLIGMELFRKFIKPKVKKLVDMAHAYGVKVMFHSCGSVIDYIDELIEVGVDILDPIQTQAVGMDPVYIKQRFGERICLHGSLDTQYTLPKGSVEEVKKEVKDRISVLGSDGGFIIGPSHTLQPDVPIQNIEAIYETTREYGDYHL